MATEDLLDQKFGPNVTLHTSLLDSKGVNYGVPGPSLLITRAGSCRSYVALDPMNRIMTASIHVPNYIGKSSYGTKFVIRSPRSVRPSKHGNWGRGS